MTALQSSIFSQCQLAPYMHTPFHLCYYPPFWLRGVSAADQLQCPHVAFVLSHHRCGTKAHQFHLKKEWKKKKKRFPHVASSADQSPFNALSWSTTNDLLLILSDKDWWLMVSSIHRMNVFNGVVSMSVFVYQDVGLRVHKDNVKICAPVEQDWRVYNQPPIRVPLTVRREHPPEEAGLLKAGGLPQKHSLCGAVGIPHGWGKNWLHCSQGFFVQRSSKIQETLSCCLWLQKISLNP